MPIILTNISCPVGTPQSAVAERAKKILRLRDCDISGAGIYKISLDARKRDDIHYVCSVMFVLRSAALEKSISSRRKDVRYFEESEPKPVISDRQRDGRVVIAGFGPAGIFCALMLSEAGYKPIVLERGSDVDSRTAAVEGFFSGGKLDTRTNVQFGEGGAGTFSDGKLTTRIGDPLCRYVQRRLVEAGAPEEIMYLAKPHIGTDRLREVVRNLRQMIIKNGGEVRFLCPLGSVSMSDGSVKEAITGIGERIPVSALVLAIGHSARDTFEMLLQKGVFIEPKAFSVGVRIEHLQRNVDISLYGGESGELGLPKGEYQLSHRAGGRAAYTFCMCPGGEVVAAASEQGGTVTNGMSRFLRDGKNANSALVVSVDRGDFPAGALGGVEFSRAIERRAYDLTGGFRAPAMTVGKFLGEGKAKPCVLPTYRPGVEFCNFDKIFPSFVCGMMRDGIRKFSTEMSCFSNAGALLTAPETRTSSPVRITRGESGAALGISNLYPCGEGAGYAGGIMSAAVDGIKTALKITESFAPCG